MHPRAENLLEHWLGPDKQRDAPANAVRQRWFAKSLEYDAWLLREHAADLDAAERGEYDAWADTPRGRVALVILLDQLTRNLRRVSRAMFDNDDKALALARKGIELGEDRKLRAAERNFLYMPFMHSESLDDQDRSVELFTQLADVEELCSSIAVLENGSVRWHGPPEGLCAQYGELRLEQAFMRCVRGN